MRKTLKLDREILDKKGLQPKVYTANQFLIWTFLKNPAYCNWREQTALASKVWVTCPDLAFWRYLADELGFKLNSLAWLMGDGKADLKTHKFFYYAGKRLKNNI